MRQFAMLIVVLVLAEPSSAGVQYGPLHDLGSGFGVQAVGNPIEGTSFLSWTDGNIIRAEWRDSSFETVASWSTPVPDVVYTDVAADWDTGEYALAFSTTTLDFSNGFQEDSVVYLTTFSAPGAVNLDSHVIFAVTHVSNSEDTFGARILDPPSVAMENGVVYYAYNRWQYNPLAYWPTLSLRDPNDGSSEGIWLTITFAEVRGIGVRAKPGGGAVMAWSAYEEGSHPEEGAYFQEVTSNGSPVGSTAHFSGTGPIDPILSPDSLLMDPAGGFSMLVGLFPDPFEGSGTPGFELREYDSGRNLVSSATLGIPWSLPLYTGHGFEVSGGIPASVTTGTMHYELVPGGPVTSFGSTNDLDIFDVGGGTYGFAYVSNGSVNVQFRGPAPTAVPAHSPDALSVTVHPNPFNPSTTISVQGSGGRNIIVQAYDSAGRFVDEVFRGITPETETVVWHPNRLPSGTYYITVSDGGTTTSSKALLLK